MDLNTIRQQLNLGIPLTSINLRVTYYSRVSTDHIDQETSLENQTAHFVKMIKETPSWTYVKGYIDNGISGTSDSKRKNFMQMIEDAKNKKFDLIITKEISRFSRNTLDSISYTRKLLSYGVGVLFLNDNINTFLPDSELRLTIMASMAQDEIRRLSHRVKFGLDAAINKGTILGNDTLYGYKKDKKAKSLVIIPSEAQIVKEIFILYVVKQKSLNQIARELNNKNIKTKYNKPWSRTTLSRIIRNIKYKGYYCGKKTEVVNYITKEVKHFKEDDWLIYKDPKKVPPIIEEDLWNKANLLLNKSSNKKRYSERKYPYSGKIYCKKSSSPFYHRQNSKKLGDTWICSEYLKNKKDSCNLPIIREKELNYILKNIFKSLELDFSKVPDILLKYYRKLAPASEESLILFQRELIRLNKMQEKLSELVTDNYISNEEFLERKTKLISEIKSKEREFKNFQNTSQNSKEIESIIVKKISSKSTFDKLLSLLLQKIVVSKDNKSIKLEIYLNYKNLPSKELTYTFKRINNTKESKSFIINYQVICASSIN